MKRVGGARGTRDCFRRLYAASDGMRSEFMLYFIRLQCQWCAKELGIGVFKMEGNVHLISLCAEFNMIEYSVLHGIHEILSHICITHYRHCHLKATGISRVPFSFKMPPMYAFCACGTRNRSQSTRDCNIRIQICFMFS